MIPTGSSLASPSLALVLALVAAGCGGGDDGGVTPADGGGTPDAAVDGGGGGPDADPGAVPRPGFGAIAGACGVLTLAELEGMTPMWFGGEMTFDNSYEDPAERSLLTPGGQIIAATPNAGGSSVLSEVFAFEWLARCELATLVKPEIEVVYDDPQSKKVDILVEIDARKVGVSVTRAFTYPPGAPYTLAAATTLFERKLDDIQLATAAVSAADRWSKQMLVTLAYDAQHAQVAMEAWDALDAQTKDDTLLITFVTSGDDAFIYTNQ